MQKDFHQIVYKCLSNRKIINFVCESLDSRPHASRQYNKDAYLNNFPTHGGMHIKHMLPWLLGKKKKKPFTLSTTTKHMPPQLSEQKSFKGKRSFFSILFGLIFLSIFVLIDLWLFNVYCFGAFWIILYCMSLLDIPS